MSDIDEAEKLYEDGVKFFKQEEYDKAIESFSKAIELKPDDHYAYYIRGTTYYSKGKYDKAIKDYTKAIELNPDDQDVYNFRGNTYDRKGEYDKAIKDYTKAIELNPDDQYAYNNRGNTYSRKGEYDKATNDYKKAFDLEVTNRKNIADLIFKYIDVMGKNVFNIEYIKGELVKNGNFGDNEIYKDKIKELSIYEHILLYFLTLKNADGINEVAYYTTTSVFEKLIKKENENLSKMRMSTLAKVNDPAEGKVLLEVLNEYTKKNIKENEDTKKEYCAVQTSFSRCIDSLTMFRLYGKTADKEGTGVSLVFNKNFFDTIFEYNQLPTASMQYMSFEGTSTAPKEIIKNIKNNKQPLYYVLYYDKTDNVLIFNPHQSNHKKIIINLNDVINNIDKVKNGKYPFEYAENFSFANRKKDDYSKVKNNIGWVLSHIFNIFINDLDNNDIQKGYKALENIKYLIKNSAFSEEQELRILEIVKYDELDIEEEKKSVYKDYFEAVSDKALEKIILAPKIVDVHSVAEMWRTHIKKEAKKDNRYEDIEVSISKAPFS